MPTLRFEAATLEEAVEAARGRVGPSGRVVGASRVRRGGVGGFFARERVEVEVEVDGDRAAKLPSRRPGGDAEEAPQRGSARHRRRGPESQASAPGDGAAADRAERAGERPPGDDPLSELLHEMAQSGPSSVLDLAESVNTAQGRYSLADRQPAPAGNGRRGAAEPGAGRASAGGASAGAGGASAGAGGASAGGASAGGARAPEANEFAEVLNRIAQEAGLVPSTEPLPTPGPAPRPPAYHASAIVRELPPDPLGAALAKQGGEPSPAPRQPAPPGRLSAGPLPLPEVPPALERLGLRLPGCAALSPAANRQQFEAQLTRALELALPPPPPLPRSPSGLVAVVGARSQAMATAKTLSAALGAPPGEITLASERRLWRQQESAVSSPDEAQERRRSWRWRDHPSVVVVDSPIRPGGSAWAAAMLRAFQPTVCWGVAPACHKPEDVAAWSTALGGLDVLAIVDLEGTSTPASALGGPVPVGLLDGQPASPAAWARLLCDRLSA